MLLEEVGGLELEQGQAHGEHLVLLLAEEQKVPHLGEKPGGEGAGEQRLEPGGGEEHRRDAEGLEVSEQRGRLVLDQPVKDVVLLPDQVLDGRDASMVVWPLSFFGGIMTIRGIMFTQSLFFEGKVSL